MVAAGASQIPEACKHVSSSHAGDGLTAGVGQTRPRWGLSRRAAGSAQLAETRARTMTTENARLPMHAPMEQSRVWRLATGGRSWVRDTCEQATSGRLRRGFSRGCLCPGAATRAALSVLAETTASRRKQRRRRLAERVVRVLRFRGSGSVRPDCARGPRLSDTGSATAGAATAAVCCSRACNVRSPG